MANVYPQRRSTHQRLCYISRMCAAHSKECSDQLHPISVAGFRRSNALVKATYSGGIGPGQFPIGQRADQEDAIPVGEPVVGQLRQAGLTAAL